MQLELSRLRRGEILAGISAVALLAFMLLMPWFAVTPSRSLDGWHSLPVLRWLLVVVAALGLALFCLQVACPAPALPVAVATFAAPISLGVTIALIIRIPTFAGSPQLAAYLGLGATAAGAVAAFWSVRDEDGWVPGAEHPIDKISVGE